MDEPRAAERFFSYFERRLAWSTHPQSGDHRTPPLIILVGGDPGTRSRLLERCRRLCARSKRVPHALVSARSTADREAGVAAGPPRAALTPAEAVSTAGGDRVPASTPGAGVSVRPDANGAPHETTVDALAHLLDELRAGLGRGRSRLGFPRYDLVRYLMGAPRPDAAKSREFDLAMRDQARQQLWRWRPPRRRERGQPNDGEAGATGSLRAMVWQSLVEKALTALIAVATGALTLYTRLHWPATRTMLVGAGVIALVSIMIWRFPGAAPSVRAARRWLRGQRYRPGGMQVEDLAASLWDHYHGGEPTWADADLRTVLIDAWYDDIDRSYGSWRLRGLFRGSRIAPCVILIDQLAPHGPGFALLKRIDERRNPRRRDRSDPVLAVAATLDDSAFVDAGHGKVPVTEVSELDPDHPPGPRQLPGRRTWFQPIRLPVGSDLGGLGAMPAFRTKEIPRWPLRPRPVFPVLVAVTLLLVVGAPYANALVNEFRTYCDAAWSPGVNTVRRAPETGECVGITDGSFVFDPELAGIEGHILAENQAVTSGGGRYVTIVVMAPFTVNQLGAAGDTNRTVLFGAAVAQGEHNRGHAVKIRVLLANSGAGTRYAEPVADDLVALARDDRSLVGVVGLGQSRRENQSAIGRLDRAGIPMVASTVTADQFGHDPLIKTVRTSYFQVAPSNRRQAAILTRFATEAATTRPLGAEWPVLPKAETAAIVYDTKDFYSKNLYEDFHSAFTATGGTATVHTYDASSTSDAQTKLHAVAAVICRDRPDLIYFAGRGPDLEWLVRGLGFTQCVSRDMVIAAGDDISTLVESRPGLFSEHPFVQLFYTAIAYPDVWDDPEFRRAGIRRPSFYQNIEQIEVPGGSLEDGQAILTYDAARVLSNAIIGAAEAVGERTPERSDIANQLGRWRSGTNAPEPIGGASGLLDLSVVTSTYAPQDKLTLLLGINSTMARPGLYAVCGKLTQRTASDPGCPAID